ncbi:MAG: hypothetical protein ACKV19_23295 [Verrucomicrobiales bacterium]
MEDPAITAFTEQLAQNPGDWFARAHLAGSLEAAGDRHGAAQVIMEAPSMPQAREHMLAAVRILTPVNPAAALPYLQLLGQTAENAMAAAPPPVPMAMPVAIPVAVPVAQPIDLAASDWVTPDPSHLAGEIHLTERVKPKFSATRFALVMGAHLVLLAVAAIWVISEQAIKKKTELEFDAQPPRVSAAKGTETAVKMAKKKSSSSAPAAAKRVLAKNSLSSIALPEIKTTSPLTDVGNLTAGMGGSGFGIGFGGTGGNGPGGSGMGGGRGRFMGGLSIDSRCTKGDRDRRIASAGGVPQTERNVVRALTWMKNNQNEDGSWGASNKASMTGLCLLSYLGHCELPDTSREYGETVLKGITWLIDLWMKREFLSEHDPKSNAAPYEHGIASYALAEAYSMTRYGTKRIPNLREAVLGSIDVIVKGQDSEGGWNYGYGSPSGGGSDMSVSGWQIQAMNAAAHTGMEFPGIEEAFKKGMVYVQNSQAENGAFGYRGKEGAKYGMTGVASLALIMGGLDRGQELRRATDFIREEWGKRRIPFEYDAAEAELYGSYYVNQVAFMRGGKLWRDWNKALQEELLPNQNEDGSYKEEGGHGSSHGSGGAGADAEIYRTALCTLMLEVYYRYLPATEKIGGGLGGD